MDAEPEGEITHLLHAWAGGEDAALQKLWPVIYTELRVLARRHMQRERADHTLQTSALVNEAYLRLLKTHDVHWCDRVHFFAVSATIMRRILVDAARTKQNGKHGGRAVRLCLDDVALVSSEGSAELLALNEALDRLAVLNPRQGKIVEMRYFGGLSESEIAGALGISDRTVRKDWSLARVWLFRELSHRGMQDDA
jgi:RNA polymerase sigma factor (TIGR02999 family)